MSSAGCHRRCSRRMSPAPPTGESPTPSRTAPTACATSRTTIRCSPRRSATQGLVLPARESGVGLGAQGADRLPQVGRALPAPADPAGGGGAHGRQGEKVGPEVGPTSAFHNCIPTGTHGPTCIFWAKLTAFSLQVCINEMALRHLEADGRTFFQVRALALVCRLIVHQVPKLQVPYHCANLVRLC